mmetsp:Transcript_8778/g.18751  ORF Transcript_8778/g.18751 Transcript_8778/m.18751 type:complete len:325 (+) Transcript_8778:859-1833(+)
MLGLQLPQPHDQVGPDIRTVLLPLLRINHPQHCTTPRRAHRVAAKRVEVESVGDACRDLGGGHHSRQGQAVADTLGHGHDVRHHALCLEAPVRCAGAPEPGLHLVRNAHASRLAYRLVHLWKVAWCQGRGTAHSLDGLCHEARHLAGCGGADEVLHVLRVLEAVSTKGAAVGVGVHGVDEAKVLGHGLLPCGVAAYAHGRHAHAMVPVPEADQVPVARVGSREHHGHVIGLRARVDKVDTLEVAGHAVRKFLCILCNLVVQVDSGCVLQELALLVDCLNHVGVTMPHAYSDDTSKSIQESATLLIKQVLHFAFNDHDGLLEVQK